MIGGIFGIAEAGANKLNGIAAQQANQSVDDYFQRIAIQSAAANGVNLEYNKDDYMRVAFPTRNELNAFANDLGNQGAEVNVSTFKVNEQWIAEVRKKNTIYRNGKASTITADTLIDDYTQNTGNAVYGVKDYTLEEAPHVDKNMANDLGRYLESNLDYLGKTIAGMGQISHLVEKYGGNANENVFTQKLENGNAVASFQNNGPYKTATVINGDTVVIDNKIVVDQRTRNYVLKQHNARMQKATELSGVKNGFCVDKNKITPPKHETLRHKTMRLNAQKIQSSMYGEQKYLAPDVKTEGRKGGSLDRMVEKLNIGMLSNGESAKFLSAVKHDLGIAFPKDNFTRTDVLNLNQAFFDAARAKNLNIDFIKNGKFNIEALKLPSVQAAFNKETLELIEKLNTNGAWGGGNGDLAGLMISGVMKMDEDGDLTRMVTTARKTINYSQKAYTSVHQYSEAVSRRIEKRRADRAKVETGNNVTSGKSKASKPKQQLNQSQVIEKEQKYIKKTMKKEERLARSEKGLVAKGRKEYNRVIGKISHSKPAKLINKVSSKLMKVFLKAFLYLLAAAIIISAVITVIVIIYCIIESIASAIGGLKKYLPSYYNKSAAFNLMENLKKREAKWMEGVEDWDKVDDLNKMAFGTNGQSIDDYIQNMDGLTVSSDGKTLYIDPFYKIVGHYSASGNLGDVRTSLKKDDNYNGELTISYSANINTYGQLKGTAANGSYLSTESGHTSNVKDIIAMTDIMFGYELDSMDDESANLLMKDPFSIDWDNFWNNWSNFWSTIGNNIATFFKNLFSSNKEEFKDIEIGGVTYKTLQAYTEYLFQATHRSQADLSVSYYPVGNVRLNVNGETVEWEDATVNQAAALGICNTPVTNTFKIFHNSSNSRYSVSPYLEDSAGNKYDLSNYDLGVTYKDGTAWHINMFDSANWQNDFCLRPSFRSNYSTWEIISGYKADGSGNVHPCWTKSDNENETYVTEIPLTITASGYSTAEEIEANALEKWNEKRDEILAGLPESSYILSSSWNTFEAKHYVKADPPECEVNSEEIPPNYDDEDTEYKSVVTGIVYRVYTEKYTRNCKGHEFEYCGGHLNVNSQGIVLSMTNEQLALAAAYNTEAEVPTVKDFDFEKYGYGELQGKHNPKDIDWSNSPTALQVSTQGGCLPAVASAQGSDAGALGINLNADENGLKKDYKIRDDIAAASIRLRDIFDADCMILKGNNVFPWGGDYTAYEGWSADNMSLAILRATTDWLDTYGMDVNLELDRNPNNNIVDEELYKHSLSGISTAEDVDKIIQSLRLTYGNNLTEEREKAVRLALSWVNRGHYNEYHDHAFLSELCSPDKTTTVSVRNEETGEIVEKEICYDVNCTASDDEGFIKFILNRTGKLYNTSVPLSVFASSSYSSVGDLYPADILRHNTGGNYLNLKLDELPSEKDLNYINDIIKAYSEERYVFVIGELGIDVELINGKSIKAGTLLTVDLQVYQNIGTVRIHAGNASSWEDVGFGDDFVINKIGKADGDDDLMKNYYWVTNPDNYTKRLRFYS